MMIFHREGVNFENESFDMSLLLVLAHNIWGPKNFEALFGWAVCTPQ